MQWHWAKPIRGAKQCRDPHQELQLPLGASRANPKIPKGLDGRIMGRTPALPPAAYRYYSFFLPHLSAAPSPFFSPPIVASRCLPLFPVAVVPSLLVVGISSKKGTPPLVLNH
ncbi:hypothetical protein B296_00026380 [Ensete ventricosum]|uniref:Uncharacterized protein n=1 Tax=Ensete ventricosum TaxID=4639 RepID=A0A426XU00_ENSVE|nr:hypothetical protein B296_00026380 [Ensete ventricosum]